MPFKNVVKQRNHKLSTSDKQIVRELLSNPRETAFLPAAEIGARIGVHESTVVRLAAKLGYSGYKELRNDLREEIAPAERIRRRLESSDNFELSTLVEQEITALQKLSEGITQSEIDSAAKTMIQARRIFLFAKGHATALTNMMDRRLRRASFDTIVLHSHGREMAERLLTLDKDDVIFACAFHTQPKGLAPLLELATQVKASSIVVSDILGVLIRPQPDIMLAASRGAENQFLTLTVPMAICNALILTIARLDDGRSLESLDTLSDLIKYFELEENE